jgi:hypothetical protein
MPPFKTALWRSMCLTLKDNILIKIIYSGDHSSSCFLVELLKTDLVSQTFYLAAFA